MLHQQLQGYPVNELLKSNLLTLKEFLDNLALLAKARLVFEQGFFPIHSTVFPSVLQFLHQSLVLTKLALIPLKQVR